MDMLLWLLAGILALAFVAAGAMKLVTPHSKLVQNPNMGWATDFSPSQVKLIGAVEVLGAAGLVLPPIVGAAEWLVPLAAAGLALDMLGAFSTHLRRRDLVAVRVPAAVLGLMALVVAVGRYWVEPF